MKLKTARALSMAHGATTVGLLIWSFHNLYGFWTFLPMLGIGLIGASANGTLSGASKLVEGRYGW
jgi:hypothetical protein